MRAACAWDALGCSRKPFVPMGKKPGGLAAMLAKVSDWGGPSGLKTGIGIGRHGGVGIAPVEQDVIAREGGEEFCLGEVFGGGAGQRHAAVFHRDEAHAGGPWRAEQRLGGGVWREDDGIEHVPAARVEEVFQGLGGQRAGIVAGQGWVAGLAGAAGEGVAGIIRAEDGEGGGDVAVGQRVEQCGALAGGVGLGGEDFGLAG